jgi:catechol 2,3-dioxygenase-like lactoylglutathione lyase family enzyme
MLANARVVPTLAVSDIERARQFYERKLGFEAEVVVEGTVRYGCGGGTALAIFERPMEAIDRTVAAFEVEDIEDEVRGPPRTRRDGGGHRHLAQRGHASLLQVPRRERDRDEAASGPESPGFGVGDVAGERPDGAPSIRDLQSGRSRRLRQRRRLVA